MKLRSTNTFLEYPTLRVFSVMPGIVATDMVCFTPRSWRKRQSANENQAGEGFRQYAKDKPEQTGAVALYLASPQAEYLRGSLTSVNWDIHELEEHKEEIEKGLLKIKYIPILPSQGGSGL